MILPYPGQCHGGKAPGESGLVDGRSHDGKGVDPIRIMVILHNSKEFKELDDHRMNNSMYNTQTD